MLVSGKNIYFDADEYEELADYYDKLDDVETAKEIVDLGLKIHPGNEFLMLRYARFLIYDAEYTAALQYLNAHFNTYDFELYLLKIECLLQLGFYAEAHQLTAEVMEDDDTETETILSELGFLYIEAEYFDEAILYFEKSLEYDPENKDVLSDLAYAYESKGDFSAAIRICEQILDTDPYAFDTWLTLGKLYSLDENYDKATDAFDFALTLDESNINVLKLKAHCLILSDRIDEAMDTLQQCIELAPDDRISRLTLADCYLNLEEPDNMLQVLDDFEAKFGPTPESTIKKAYAFFLKGDTRKSEKLIQQVLAENSDSPEVCIITGNLYYKTGEMTKAEELYKKALSIDSDYEEDVLNKLVVIYLNQNEIKKAIDQQKRLVEIVGTSSDKVKLALLYLEAGDKNDFKEYADSLEDEDLSSLLAIFYPDEQINLSNIDRNYILMRLDDVFESRLLYKNIKY